MSDFEQFSTSIDHLGVIAVMCDDIGISEIIDEFIGIHHNQTVSCGQATKAMIINMLAIFMRPLYLLSKYLDGKPVHRLIAENLKAEDFTDDVLGRTLDKLYEHDLEAIFMKISSVAFSKYGDFQSPYLHGDTSLIKVHGEYDRNFDNAIEITYGYSKSERKDLKQFLISMITCDNLPVFISTLSGNESDKVSLREMTKKYGESITSMFTESKTFVFDSSFYSATTVKACDFPWITRVPEHITEAKDLLFNLDSKKLQSCNSPGYKLYSDIIAYAGVKQRWIVVYSSKAYEKEKKSLDNLIIKEADKIKKLVWHFSSNEFESKADGLKEANNLDKKIKYHSIRSVEVETIMRRKTKTRGRPKKDETMIEFYKFHVRFRIDEDAVEKELKHKGRFIIATNIMEEISDEECLIAYKDQQKIERGFRFIKDPMFFVDGVYLKNENRIMSMVMLMGISLLVYSLLEKKIRYSFKLKDELYVDGYRKATKNPTMKRVLLAMEDIHLHCISYKDKIVDEKIKNMRPESFQALRILGPEYEKMYSDKGGEVEVTISWKK